MADFWVTQQKHWCKYCKKYLYNNKATIQKHESGAAHKLQVEQFLSNVYKKGKEDKKEAENVRRELERIEKAANKAMGISISEENELSDTAETVKKSIPQTPIKQYSKTIKANLPPPPSLASLQASSSSKTTQLKGKEEWAIKNEVAMVGQWETVTAQEETKIPSKTTKTEPLSSLQNDNSNNNNNEDDDDDEDAQEDLSQFKIKEKEYPIDTFDTPDDNIEDNQNTGSLFKKRKLGQKGNLNTKKKAFRKKD